MVYLPQGSWYDFWSRKKYVGGSMIRTEAPLDVVPMFIRAGAIIPKWPPMNHVNEKAPNPVTFEIYPDEKGEARTVLYEDDGSSPEYKRGVFRRTAIEVSRSANGYLVAVAAPVGSYNPGKRQFAFVLGVGTMRRQTLRVDEGRPQSFIIR
jgi:alpha-glucosidase (family GH31 glycosyl hydrolase)